MQQFVTRHSINAPYLYYMLRITECVSIFNNDKNKVYFENAAEDIAIQK